MMKKNPHPVISMVFLAGLLFGLANAQVVFQDPDTLWHIRAGDLIRAHGITTHEPWSWTAGEYPWVNIAWLPDITMSRLYESGGLPLIKQTTLLLFALILAALAALGVTLQVKPAILVIPLFYTAGILAEGMLARPHLLSLLFAIAAYTLLRFAAGKRLWLLVPLAWLWASCHGGYIALFMLLGLFGIEAWQQKNTQRVRQLVLIGLTCFAVIFANPYGAGIIQVTLAVLSGYSNHMNMEWQPTAPAQYLYLLGWLLLLVIAGGMQQKDIPLADKLLVIIWLVLAMMSVRMTYLAAIFSFPYLVLSLSAWSNRIPSSASSRTMTDNPKTRLAAVVAAAMGCVFLFSPLYPMMVDSPKLSKATSPSQELEFIAKHYPDLRLFTHYNFGGYIIYRRDLGIKPFIDGRAETAYPKDVVADYFSIQQMNDGWRNVIARRDIQGLLLPLYNVEKPDEKALQIQVLDREPNWKRVFTGAYSAVYIRRDLVR